MLIMEGIEAVIFDMDGIIIESEGLWKKAMIIAFKNIGYDFTIEMCDSTKGMRVDEVSYYWKNKLKATYNPEEITNTIVKHVIQLINDEGKPLIGLMENINRIKEKGLKIGLASSSPMNIIDVVLNKLNIAKNFDFVHSAEYEDYGKPHPQVFITTANKLNVSPSNCLVIEDSLNGIIAAKAAKMKVVAIPENGELLLAKFIIADKIVTSHNEIIF
jgi:HAD superfamily hydrolase (TIGR01509 family)